MKEDSGEAKASKKRKRTDSKDSISSDQHSELNKRSKVASEEGKPSDGPLKPHSRRIFSFHNIGMR